MSQEPHPLHELVAAIGERIKRIGAAKSFDGELARRELRDELYPIVAEVVSFMGELDDRVGAIEEGNAGGGITPELAEAIVEALAKFGAILDMSQKYAGAMSNDDARTLREVHAWFMTTTPELIEDVRAAVEGEPEPQDPNQDAGPPPA